MNNDKDTLNKLSTSEIKIGEYLKKIRLDNNLTQTQISEKLGIKRSTYSNYEQNLREPSLSVLSNLSKIFNIDLNEMITGNKNNSFCLSQKLYDSTSKFLNEFQHYEREIGNRCFRLYEEDQIKLTEMYYFITKAYIEANKAHDIEALFISKHY